MLHETCLQLVVDYPFTTMGGFSFLHIEESHFRGNEGLVEWTNASKGGPKKVIKHQKVGCSLATKQGSLALSSFSFGLVMRRQWKQF